MESVTLSDFLLRSVVWFSIAALVLMLLLLLEIARLRAGLIARKAHEQHFLKAWQPLLAAAVAGDGHGNSLPPLAREDHILFLRLLNHLHESLRGNARRQLNIIALRVGMLQHAYALLQQRGLGKKLLALATLGHLGDRHDWGAILEVARRPDPLLSLAAARALFQIDAAAALRDLKGPIIERADWPAAELGAILQEAGKADIYGALTESAVNLAASTEPVAATRLKRLLQMLGAAPYPHTIPAIRAILAASVDDEVLAQCLRFLREPGDLPLVRANLWHANWVVRLQVARALGRFGAAQDMPSLAGLLSDPVWWVRYRAAEALLALAHGDARALSDLRAHLDDRYARDMLDMVAAEKGRPW